MTAAGSSRRGLLSGLALASAATALLHGCAQTTAHAAGPDAELIQCCAEFTDLERRKVAIQEAVDPNGGMAAQRAADRLTDPLHDRQAELLDRIWELEATTLAGFMARARMVAVYAPDYIAGEDPGMGWQDHMAAALVRDMVGMNPPTG